MAKKKASTEVFDTITVDSGSSPEDIDTLEIRPDYASPQWSDYVLSKFTSDELEDGKPRVVGLRRVVQSLLGNIRSSKPTNVFYIDGRSVVVWEIDIDMDFGPCTFGGTADASRENLYDETFAVFPTAMAEVRAEARALKRALQINVVSAEEIVKRPATSVDVPVVENSKISDIQVKFLTNKCKQLEISVTKFAGVDDLASLNRDDAAKLIGLINDYQSGKVQIPVELKS